MRLIGTGFCLATGLLLAGVPTLADQTGNANPEIPASPLATLTAADLADGRRLFTVHCARCHGMLGDGGEGPSLKRPRLTHAADDQALFDVINEGIRGTGMPGTFGPNDEELWRIAGHVRSLGQLPAEVMPGDPERGGDLYNQRGACATCHILDGRGRGVGPELSDVGLRRNVEYLRRSLTDPDADSPMLSGWQTGRINAFLTVRVVAADGEFEGLRVNEDEFSIQLRDLSGNIRSFDKRELLNFEKAFGHSLMPGYEANFTASEIDDLVSYLMTLTGES
ncbi:MAG: c-type cytochrome [Pseudomonadales bacterium]|nr:c-type cytochrome [Pseudomonadales bacterium]